MKRMKLQIDVSDWEEEALRDELLPESKEEIIEHLEKGQHTAKVARSTIIAREKKVAPDDIKGDIAHGMADVSLHIWRHPADIHADLPLFQGDEIFFLTG